MEIKTDGQLIPPAVLGQEKGPGLFCLALYREEIQGGEEWWRTARAAKKPHAVYLGEAQNLALCLSGDRSGQPGAGTISSPALIKLLNRTAHVELEVASKARAGESWTLGKPRLDLEDEDSRRLAMKVALLDLEARREIEILKR